MRTYLAVVAFAVLLVASPARAALRIEPVPLPAYADIPHAAEYASASDYATAASDRRFALRRFAYPSDGLTVYGYLYGPRRAAESSRSSSSVAGAGLGRTASRANC
jgi:hypothetical protein